MPKKNIKSSWRSAQSKTKNEQKTKLALAVLVLVAGLIIVSWSVRFAQSLFSPWKQISSIHRHYLWQGNFSINLILRTPAISIFSYNPKEEKVVIVNLPDETFLPLSRDFGSWQLRAVYGLGGAELLKDSLAAFLGIPIDGFLDLTALKSQKPALQIVENVRKNPVGGLDFASLMKTDLTAWELLKLKLGINGVRFDKVEDIDLVKYNVLDSSNLSDGTQIYTADPVKLDNILSKLADPTIVSEHKSIAVFNATDHPQLAQKWARLITNLGGNVIITSNAKKKLKNTQVAGEESQTLMRLRQVFDLSSENEKNSPTVYLDCQNNPKCDKIGPSDEDLASSRAQINLFLGEDYASK